MTIGWRVITRRRDVLAFREALRSDTLINLVIPLRSRFLSAYLSPRNYEHEVVGQR